MESIKSLSGWCCKDCKTIYRFWKRRIGKQDESNDDLQFTTAIGFGGKLSSYYMKKKYNLENGEEYVGITKTPYWNMMLDRRVLRT